MVAGCEKQIGDHGLGIKHRVARDPNLGRRSGRLRTQRSVAEWIAEAGAEAAQIRRAGVMRLLGLPIWDRSEGFAEWLDRPRLG